MNVSTLQAISGYGMTAGPKPDAMNAVAGAAEEFMATLRAGEAQAAAAVTGGGDPMPS